LALALWLCTGPPQLGQVVWKMPWVMANSYRAVIIGVDDEQAERPTPQQSACLCDQYSTKN